MHDCRPKKSVRVFPHYQNAERKSLLSLHSCALFTSLHPQTPTRCPPLTKHKDISIELADAVDGTLWATNRTLSNGQTNKSLMSKDPDVSLRVTTGTSELESASVLKEATDVGKRGRQTLLRDDVRSGCTEGGDGAQEKLCDRVQMSPVVTKD